MSESASSLSICCSVDLIRWYGQLYLVSYSAHFALNGNDKRFKQPCATKAEEELKERLRIIRFFKKRQEVTALKSV